MTHQSTKRNLVAYGKGVLHETNSNYFRATFLTNLTFADSALEKEKTESQKFIDKEAKMAKTEQTLSGLLYRPVKEGNGAYPGATDTVTVEYKGTLRTGKVFDASPKSQPASFPLNGVIPCWTEALKKCALVERLLSFAPLALLMVIAAWAKTLLAVPP